MAGRPQGARAENQPPMQAKPSNRTGHLLSAPVSGALETPRRNAPHDAFRLLRGYRVAHGTGSVAK